MAYIVMAHIVMASGKLETQRVIVQASMGSGPCTAAAECGDIASAVDVQISDCSAEAFRRFLRWVYTDELEVDPGTVADVLLRSDCYCLPVLREQCAQAAVPLLTVANISEMVFAAERVHDGTGALRDACRDFVLEHLDELEGTPAYSRLLDDKDFMSRMLKHHRTVTKTLTEERACKRQRPM